MVRLDLSSRRSIEAIQSGQLHSSKLISMFPLQDDEQHNSSDGFSTLMEVAWMHQLFHLGVDQVMNFF